MFIHKCVWTDFSLSFDLNPEMKITGSCCLPRSTSEHTCQCVFSRHTKKRKSCDFNLMWFSHQAVNWYFLLLLFTNFCDADYIDKCTLQDIKKHSRSFFISKDKWWRVSDKCNSNSMWLHHIYIPCVTSFRCCCR